MNHIYKNKNKKTTAWRNGYPLERGEGKNGLKWMWGKEGNKKHTHTCEKLLEPTGGLLKWFSQVLPTNRKTPPIKKNGLASSLLNLTQIHLSSKLQTPNSLCRFSSNFQKLFFFNLLSLSSLFFLTIHTILSSFLLVEILTFKLSGSLYLYTITKVVGIIQTPLLQLIMTDQGMLQNLISLQCIILLLFCLYLVYKYGAFHLFAKSPR